MAEPTNKERAAWAPPTNKDRALHGRSNRLRLIDWSLAVESNAKQYRT